MQIDNSSFKYVILGGGTAGWLTALFVKEKFPYSDVTVIASSEIGILGAGEGTVPTIINFLKEININPEDVIKHAKGTIKNGIKFTNWNGDNSHYYHSFSSNLQQEQLFHALFENKKINIESKKIFDSNNLSGMSLHFDANKLADYLKTIGLVRNIKLIDNKVEDFVFDSDNNIVGLTLETKITIDCDFVFDCSGFKRLIIGKHFKSKWNCYKKTLPMKRAMPFFLDNTNEGNLPPYTDAIAMKYGWMWKIPVQGRYGCGYVYDSDYVSDEDIKLEIEEFAGIKLPENAKTFNFDAGYYEDTWVNNCVAIGLSANFIEPLEATSIYVTTSSLIYLLECINGITLRDKNSIDNYNSSIREINSKIAKFIYFHYLTNRKDSDFWKEFRIKRTMPSEIYDLLELSKNKNLSETDLDSLAYSSNKYHKFLTGFTSHNWLIVSDGLGLSSYKDTENSSQFDINDFLDHSEYLKYAKSQ